MCPGSCLAMTKIIESCEYINSAMFTPSGHYEAWADLVNSYCGLVRFSHDVIIYIPRRMLWYHIDAYSRIQM